MFWTNIIGAAQVCQFVPNTGVGCATTAVLLRALLDPESTYAIDPCTLDFFEPLTGTASCSDADVYAIQSTFEGDTYTILWSDGGTLTPDVDTYVQLFVGTDELEFDYNINAEGEEWGGGGQYDSSMNTSGRSVQINALYAFNAMTLSECCERVHSIFRTDAFGVFRPEAGYGTSTVLEIFEGDTLIGSFDRDVDAMPGVPAGVGEYYFENQRIVSQTVNRFFTTVGVLSEMYFVLFEGGVPVSAFPKSSITWNEYTSAFASIMSDTGRYVIVNLESEGMAWYSVDDGVLTFMDAVPMGAYHGDISVVDPAILDEFCLTGDPVPDGVLYLPEMYPNTGGTNGTNGWVADNVDTYWYDHPTDTALSGWKSSGTLKIRTIRHASAHMESVTSGRISTTGSVSSVVMTDGSGTWVSSVDGYSYVFPEVFAASGPVTLTITGIGTNTLTLVGVWT
jgi:hypothetical protein